MVARCRAPGLVAVPGAAASSLLLTVLSNQEWAILGAFETANASCRNWSSRQVTGGARTSGPMERSGVRPGMQPDSHLPAYAGRCARHARRWQQDYRGASGHAIRAGTATGALLAWCGPTCLPLRAMSVNPVTVFT